MESRPRDLNPEPWDLPSPAAREAAQRSLTQLVDRAADGRAHCFWIEGEAGAGKTALLDLLAQRAGELGCVVLRADCPLPGEGELPWSRMLAGAQPALPLEQLAASLGSEAGADLVLLIPALAVSAPARPAPPGLREVDHVQRRWRSLARLLEVIARRAPVVLVIDDVQRSSAELLQGIGFLFRALLNAPLLWIFAGERPTREEDLPSLRQTFERQHRLTSLTLGPFKAEELTALLEASFGPEDLERMVAWLIEKTGGNPLFVHEVMCGLIESGAIVRPAGEGRYGLVGELETVTIPRSFEGMVRSQLEGFSPRNRLVLRALAALGGEGSGPALRKLTGSPAREMEEAIGELRTGGLVTHSPTGGGRFHLRQDWLGQVALDAFPDPAREALCLRAAEALSSDRDLPDAIRLSRRARALEKAGPGLWAAAAAAHEEAARMAWAQHSQGAARSHIESALRILERFAPPVRTSAEEKTFRALEEKVLDLAGVIHTVIGPFQSGVEELERLRVCLELRRPAPRPERWVACEQLLGQAHRNLGNYEAALECYQRALGWLRGKGTTRLRAEILLEVAWARYEMGDPEEGLRVVRRAVRALRRVGTSFDYCRARNLEGLVTWAQCRFHEATLIFQDTLKRMESLGTIPLEAAVWNNLGLVHWNLGALDEATRCLTRSRRIRVAMGQLLGEAVTLANLGLVEEDRGNLEAAIRLHRGALRIRESLGDRRGAVIGLGNLANILRQTGELEEARELIDRALADCRAVGVPDLEAGLLCTRSGIHRQLGGGVEAMEEAKQAIRMAERFHNTRLIAYGLENAARAAADLGRIAEARTRMKRAKETIASASPIDAATILISEAEMLGGLAAGLGGVTEAGTSRAARLREEARRSATEAVALFEKHGVPARVARARGLLESLGLAVAAAPGPSPQIAPVAPGTEGRLRIHSFGPLRIVTASGKEIGPGDWGSHKARAIFSYLLFHRSPEPSVPRERILETIWPEAPMDTVENTFHATLALLRKVLAGAGEPNPPWATVVHSGGCYRLEFAAEPWIDCAVFEESLRDGARWHRQGNYYRALAAYRQAEALYRADFLEDSYVAWTDSLRDRYRQDCLDLLLRLGTLSLETWSPADALHWANRLRARDPLEDRTCRLGMHAHLALGHRKAAIDLYQRFATQLQEDLGAVPEALTTETFRRIKAGQPPPPLAATEGRSGSRTFGSL